LVGCSLYRYFVFSFIFSQPAQKVISVFLKKYCAKTGGSFSNLAKFNLRVKEGQAYLRNNQFMNSIKQFDVAVIGGGPAGMMAAGQAAKNGVEVVLLEKNKILGKKLLITGKGRCNITNIRDDNREFIKRLGPNGPFLFSALAAFGPKDVVDFFQKRGVETKVERGGRVFPVSDSSADVSSALVDFVNEGRVRIIKEAKIKKIVLEKNLIKKIILADNDLEVKKVILATGGLAYPGTGSTGDGYIWAKHFGHEIIKPTPALVPILVKDKWVKELEGLSLKNVSIAVYQNNKKTAEEFGEALFTDRGMSGPIILDLSQAIGQVLDRGSVELKINFKPALDWQTLDLRLKKDFKQNPKKAFKNSLDQLLPQKLIPIFIKFSKINENKKAGQLTRSEINSLLKLFFEFTLTVEGLDGFEKAIVTSGGISLKEINPKTMGSKIIKNLFFAGEIIDLNGPTGGYNLQIAFATGYLAGNSN
jgi:hypothetical protein